jgi:hypothetical protein
MEFLSFVPELVLMLLHIKIMYFFLVPGNMTVHVVHTDQNFFGSQKQKND